MNKNSKIYVAGHTGLFGSAVARALIKRGYSNLVAQSHKALDLTDPLATMSYLQKERPDVVVMAAGVVGGIEANRTRMADFIMSNMLMACSVINAAHKLGNIKLLYLGSSCLYPALKNSEMQPLTENALLTGSFEPTNEGYALAKIAGIKMCDYYRKQYGDKFISCIPANVYGQNDNFHGQGGHVIPMLMRRMHEAKMNGAPFVEIWGTGKPQREFMHVDDAADACVFLLEQYDMPEPVNIGVGYTTSIRELAHKIRATVDYSGELVFDAAKPDGMAGRLLDNSKIRKLGWKPAIDLDDGLAKTYAWYLENQDRFV